MAITFGINIVEIVTSGLYPNALDTFREYIQNSCDSIDKAVEAGILSEGEGKIDIAIDKTNRRITIEDNGTGISAARDFERIMSNIGNSDKTLQTDRGFRGIGRLCGLTYCKTLVFTAKAAGEKKISKLTIDAENIRDKYSPDRKYLAEQVLSSNMIFDTLDATDVNEHFFRVELIDIVKANDTLLDINEVRKYLLFVAPVTYSSKFYYQTKIYEHAAALGFKITEYQIFLNKDPLYKNYKTNIQASKYKDEIFDIYFRDFYNDQKELIAWSWIGLSKFQGVLDSRLGTADNLMRGIRLRTGNIQIGDSDVFKDLFIKAQSSEDRGTKYFIGEVHTVDTNLIPNSRRDYFEENDACKTLENTLIGYFRNLIDIYRTASEVRNAFKANAAPIEEEDKFNRGRSKYKNRNELEIRLGKLKKIAQSKAQFIDKKRKNAEKNPDSPLSRVILRIIENTPPRSTIKSTN